RIGTAASPSASGNRLLHSSGTGDRCLSPVAGNRWPVPLLLHVRRGLLAHLLEVLLHVRLQGHGDFVAADFRAPLSVLCTLLRIGRAQLLIGGLHFHGGFAADVGGALAEDLADLAHGGELLGVTDGLIAILAADAAAGLLAGLLGIALALPFPLLRVLGILGFLAVLAFLRIALLAALLRLAILAVLLLGARRLALGGFLLFALLLGALLVLLGFGFGHQILEGVLQLAHEAGTFARTFGILLLAVRLLVALPAFAVALAVGAVFAILAGGAFALRIGIVGGHFVVAPLVGLRDLERLGIHLGEGFGLGIAGGLDFLVLVLLAEVRLILIRGGSAVGGRFGGLLAVAVRVAGLVDQLAAGERFGQEVGQRLFQVEAAGKAVAQRK